jgi:hypothetical protein
MSASADFFPAGLLSPAVFWQYVDVYPDSTPAG